VDEFVEVKDFSLPKPIVLFSVDDNRGSACFPEPSAGNFAIASISAVEWADLNGDEWQDVTANISFAAETWKSPPSPRNCQAEADRMSERLENGAKTYTLEFQSYGTYFMPTAETQRVLDNMDHVRQLAPKSAPAN
jgi:hypothetical protein